MSPSPPPSHHSAEGKTDSKKRPSTSTESGQPAKVTKRRAARACVSCRARKVRCDVVEGAPCGNCRWDNVEVRLRLHQAAMRILHFTHTRSHARLRHPFPFRHIAQKLLLLGCCSLGAEKRGVSSAELLTCEYGTSGGSLTRKISCRSACAKTEKRNHIKLTVLFCSALSKRAADASKSHCWTGLPFLFSSLPTMPRRNFPQIAHYPAPPTPVCSASFPAQRCAAPVASAHASLGLTGRGRCNDKARHALFVGAHADNQPRLLFYKALHFTASCFVSTLRQAWLAGRSSRADH